jgi:gliding motility-associated-like protein
MAPAPPGAPLNKPVCESARQPAPDAGKRASTFGVAVPARFRHQSRMRRYAPFLLLLGHAALAQPANVDCSTAQQLCAQQGAAGTTVGSTGSLSAFCQPNGAQLWYRFTTNSQGGTVQVSLNGIECQVGSTLGDELSVVVLSGACPAGPFQSVSGACAIGSSAVAVQAQALAPNTSYWVVVAGQLNGGAVIPAQCGFEIAVSGPGANIVGVDFSAGPDQEIAQGDAAQLNATGGNGYSWSPTTGLSGASIANPIANPSGTTIYTVSTTLGGCEFIDTVAVNVIRLINPPNTFSPNDDGRNDTWEVPGINDYPGSIVIIYDRWGQKVFSSNGYREPWDGKHNGRPLSEGSYYYYIELNQLKGRSAPYTGYISIIR